MSSVGANGGPMVTIVDHMGWERIGIIYRNINLYEVEFYKIYFFKNLECFNVSLILNSYTVEISNL